ncbi:MAG: TolC family protein [Candidatus Wallbacteria bacterium]|nr:TolC family protein [Candidatus Wallbacteria bacterium]
MSRFRSPIGCRIGALALILLLPGEPLAAGLPAGYSELDARVREALASVDAASMSTGETLASPLDPRQIGRLAARVNPEAIEALTRVRRQLLAVRKELGLPDVELKLEASDFTRVPEFNSMQGNMLAISRVFPLGGKLSGRAAATFHGARQAYHEYEGIVLDLIKDARAAAAELYSAERQTRILNDNIALSRQMAEVARIKYTTGLVIQQDVLKAEVEAARYENEQLETVRMADVARSMLATLLVRPVDAPIPPASLPTATAETATVEQLESMARSTRPELLAAAAAAAKAQAELRIANAERHRPDLMGQVGYMQNPLGDMSSWQAMVGINLPWFNSRRKHEVAEAAAGAAGEGRRLEAVWNRTRFVIREAHLRVRESAASVALFRDKLVPQANQTFDSARANYETDRVDFLTLVDAQRMLKESTMGQVRAEAELERRRADLDRAVGTRAQTPAGQEASR